MNNVLRSALLLLLVTLIPSSAFAGFYKCKVNGQIRYQSTPCPKGSDSQQELEVGKVAKPLHEEKTQSKRATKTTDNMGNTASEQNGNPVATEEKTKAEQLCSVLVDFKKNNLKTLAQFKKKYADLTSDLTLIKVVYVWSIDKEIIKADVQDDLVVDHSRYNTTDQTNANLDRMFSLNPTPTLKGLKNLLGNPAKLTTHYTLNGGEDQNLLLMVNDQKEIENMEGDLNCEALDKLTSEKFSGPKPGQQSAPTVEKQPEVDAKKLREKLMESLNLPPPMR